MTNRQPQFRGGDAGGNGDFVRYGAVIIENRVGLTGMSDVQRARVEWNASFRDPVSVWLALFADCAPQNRFVPVFSVETPLPVRIAGKMELFSVFADGETFLKQTLSRPVTAVEVAAVDDLVVAFAEQLGDVDTQNAVSAAEQVIAGRGFFPVDKQVEVAARIQGYAAADRVKIEPEFSPPADVQNIGDDPHGVNADPCVRCGTLQFESADHVWIVADQSQIDFQKLTFFSRCFEFLSAFTVWCVTEELPFRFGHVLLQKQFQTVTVFREFSPAASEPDGRDRPLSAFCPEQDAPPFGGDQDFQCVVPDRVCAGRSESEPFRQIVAEKKRHPVLSGEEIRIQRCELLFSVTSGNIHNLRIPAVFGEFRRPDSHLFFRRKQELLCGEGSGGSRKPQKKNEFYVHVTTFL